MAVDEGAFQRFTAVGWPAAPSGYVLSALEAMVESDNAGPLWTASVVLTFIGDASAAVDVGDVIRLSAGGVPFFEEAATFFEWDSVGNLSGLKWEDAAGAHPSPYRFTTIPDLLEVERASVVTLSVPLGDALYPLIDSFTTDSGTYFFDSFLFVRV